MLSGGYRQSITKLYRPICEAGDKAREKKGKGYRGKRREEIIKQGIWKASMRRWHLRKG